MRKILFIAGSRGEYGYIRPIIKEIKKDDAIDYEVLVTNMHLLEKFGKSVEHFKKDNIEIHHKIYNTLDGYNNTTMAKSLGIFLLQIPEILEKSNPDIVLVSGDRGEQLMATIAACHMNIPVVHIQAGEKSGNIDGQVRHSITKLAHIHLCSNKDAYNRVINLGEEKFRVFNTGAPLVDELIDDNFIIRNIRSKLNINNNKDIFLIVNHSISEESDKSGEQMEILLNSIEKYDVNKIFIMPNSDAGSLNIRKILSKKGSNNLDKDKFGLNYVFYNLPRIDYINLMRECKIMIGNSSSGIMEAPTFKLPVINIGRRQIGRLQGGNVINVEKYDKRNIQRAIDKGLSKKFTESLENIKNPYGEKCVSKNIVNILKNTKINNKLLNKEITY